MNRQAPPVEVFERGYRETLEAFNRHDLETAFAGLPPDLEWRTLSDAPGADVARGRDGVVRGFRLILEEFPDWRVEAREFIDADPAILIRNVATGTGRSSGAPIRLEFTQVWTFRDGRASRVNEYADHAEALAAVGLAPGGSTDDVP